MIINFKTWLEAFETPSDFLLNPENKHKTFNELLMQFQNEGGHAEYGKYGTVLISPKWPYVIKIFPSDEEYVRFARFAYKHPHPSFPKIFGPPQKIIPFFKRTKSWTQLYVVRIEKLFPVQDKEMMTLIVQNYQWGVSFFNAAKYGLENREFDKQIWPKRSPSDPYGSRNGPQTVRVKEYQHVFDLFAKYPQIKNLYQAIYIIETSDLKGSPDIHSGNIMQRKDEELVLIDPLWAGSNPYMDALAQQRMEYDGYSDFDDEPEQILGGELPKKKRKKKFKPYRATGTGAFKDDVPF